MASDSVIAVSELGGELVTYEPHGGVEKTFKALVDRRPTQVEHAGGFAYTAQTMEMWIPKDATQGMMEIHERKDRVRVKKNLSDAQETRFTVQTIMQEDAGMLPFDTGMFHVMVQA